MKIVSRPEDDAAVCAFERLVHSQPPPGKRWTPVTDYSFEARKAIEGPRPQLLKDVFQPESVLDAGCGPGHLVTLLRQAGIARVYGIDKDATGWMHGVEQVDLTDELPSDVDGEITQYDLVVCREVLEHLTIRQLREAVRNLVRLSKSFIYVTTRFADDSKNPTPEHLLTVQTSDDLDPDHRTMLTRPFLRLLFVLEGCKSRLDLEAAMDWEDLHNCLVLEVPR